MTRNQLLLLPVLAAILAVLAGALHQKAADGKQPPVPAAPTATDPKALALLDRAIEALGPEHVRWLEATLWQQVRSDDFSYQACGRVLTAPDERLRFDMNVKVGKTQGELRMVSDGRVLWQSIRLGGDTPLVSHWELPSARDMKIPAAQLPQARTQVLHDQGFAGMAPLLRSLRGTLQSAQGVQQTWKGRTVYVISGTWPEDAARLASLPDTYRPCFRPHLCTIYLDAQTSWPHRLEWWGSDKPGQTDCLLVQTEFRNPVINRPLSPQQCKAEFSFP